ncbi:MAG: hypothetical protein JXB07_11790 [Anaerolineae bacterium]|nr:hypothetical protein [Anaerolineae bacterium]
MGVVTLAVLVFVGLVFILPQVENHTTGSPAIGEPEPSTVVSPATSILTIEPLAPDLVVYDDAFGEGWEDWSWHDDTIVVDYANGDPVHSGSSSIAVTYIGGWSGLQIGDHGETFDANTYDTLRFRIHGGATGGQTIISSINNNLEQPVMPQAGVWTQVDVPLLLPGRPRTIYNMAWFNNTGCNQGVFYIDDIVLVDTGLPTPTSLPPGPG